MWVPIGDYATDTKLTFKGKFEGNNHTILGIYINNTKIRQGLFGNITNSTIKKLQIDNSYIQGGYYIGGIAGGIVAFIGNNSNVIQCINYAKVKAEYPNAAGIAGVLHLGRIEECINYGNIVSNKQTVGEISGQDHTYGVLHIKNCYNIGNITANSYASQIIGYFSNTQDVVNSYYKGQTFNATTLGEAFTED